MTHIMAESTQGVSQSAAGMLSWLGATTARLLACADEASLAATVYDAIHGGLGLDRVGLVLLNEERDEWFWALCCDASGRPYAWPERYPAKSIGQFINLERFAGGVDVSYVPDLWAILTPQQRAHEDSRIHENLAVALRRSGASDSCTEASGAPDHTASGAPDHADLVGFLSVDNLPSGRPLTPELRATLAVFGQVLAQAIESVRLRQSERAARQAAERHAAREAALVELIAFVNTSLSPTVVAQRATATLRAIFEGADEVWLWLISDDRLTIDLLATDGVPSDRADVQSSLPLDSESYIIARVLQENRAEFFEHMADVLDTWPPTGAQLARAYSSGFIAMLPLADAEGALGVLGLAGRKPRRIPREDRAFLYAVAGHVGTALSNARVALRMQRTARRAGGLLEMARTLNRLGSTNDMIERAAHMAAPVLDCGVCAIYLLDDDGAHYTLAIRIGGPDDVEVTPPQRHPPADIPELLPLRAGEPVLLDRTTTWQGPYAAILLPLRRDEQTFGYLALIDPDVTRHFQPEEIAVGQSMAVYIATALENTRLRDEAARAEATREANRLKDELLATVSHELRTPLGTIKGFATALLEYDAFIDPQERRSFLHLIDDASDRLRTLVNDLLDAGRMESRGVRLTLAPVDLRKLLRDTIREMAPRLSDHPIRVRVGSDVPTINGDAGRLRQVIQNLLENAAKYSAAPNPITITVSHDREELRVRVLDRGIGIPAEHLPLVFERFHRVDNSFTRSAGGTGLGLAIARGIVEAHGGRIWAESKGEGQGTTISFTLSLKGAE